MNILLKKVRLIFLIIAVVAGQINALGAKRDSKKVVVLESPATEVNKQVSVLDQIVEQAGIIVEAMGPKAQTTRAIAKRELNKLMKDLKNLDPQTHDVIKETIETIKGATVKNKAETKQAFDSLTAVINSMDAQANVISTIEEGRIAIELAPAEMKQEVISQQVQNVQAAEAQAEQAGLISRMVGGIKSTLAKPGNYFFGEQRTNAKTAFEAAVGVAVVGGLSYLAYKLTPEGTGEGTLTKLQGLYSRGKKALGFESTKKETVGLKSKKVSPGKETSKQTETTKRALEIEKANKEKTVAVQAAPKKNILSDETWENLNAAGKKGRDIANELGTTVKGKIKEKWNNYTEEQKLADELSHKSPNELKNLLDGLFKEKALLLEKPNLSPEETKQLEEIDVPIRAIAHGLTQYKSPEALEDSLKTDLLPQLAALLENPTGSLMETIKRYWLEYLIFTTEKEIKEKRYAAEEFEKQQKN